MDSRFIKQLADHEALKSKDQIGTLPLRYEIEDIARLLTRIQELPGHESPLLANLLKNIQDTLNLVLQKCVVNAATATVNDALGLTTRLQEIRKSCDAELSHLEAIYLHKLKEDDMKRQRENRGAEKKPVFERLKEHPLVNGSEQSLDSFVEMTLPEVQLFAARLSGLPSPALPLAEKQNLEAVAKSLIRALNAYRREGVDESYFISYARELSKLVAHGNEFLARAENQIKAVEFVEKKEEIKVLQGEKADAASNLAEDYFQKKAGRDFWEAIAWGCIALLAGAFAIVYIHVHIGSPIPTPRWTAIMLIHEVVPRIIIISILTYITVWCAGNARSSNHNRMLDHQREAAMKAFPDFRNAAKNQPFYGEVILKAMEPLYREHRTGYLDGEQKDSSTPTTVGTVTKVMKETKEVVTS